jgi:hypothetical protein
VKLGALTEATAREVAHLLDAPRLGHSQGLDNAAARGWVVKEGNGVHASYDLTAAGRRAMATLAFAHGVYFVEGMGLIKIGIATNVICRFAELQRGNAAPLTLLGYVPRANQAVERWLHARYAARRHHGEWFEPNDELRALAEGKRSDILRRYNPEQVAGQLAIPLPLLYRKARRALAACDLSNPETGERYAAIDVDAVADALARIREGK